MTLGRDPAVAISVVLLAADVARRLRFCTPAVQLWLKCRPKLLGRVHSVRPGGPDEEVAP